MINSYINNFENTMVFIFFTSFKVILIVCVTLQILSLMLLILGGISRLSKKLIAKDLIESYQKENNQKEIYFRLTNKGIDIFNTNNKVHNEILNRDKKVFDAINNNDYKVIIDFIDYYRNHLESEFKKLKYKRI